MKLPKFLLCLAVLSVGLQACTQDCGTPPSGLILPAALSETGVQRFVWGTENAESFSVPVTGAKHACIQAESTAAWINTTMSRTGDLTINFDANRPDSGLHQEYVKLLWKESGQELARVPVTVRALRKPPTGATRHVLFVGWDGTRGDAARLAATPNLDELAAHGAWSFSASSQTSAARVSGPGWASILTGVEPTKHHVVSNDSFGDYAAVTYPTFVKRIHDHVGKTVVAATWPALLGDFLEPEGGVDKAIYGWDEANATALADAIAEGDYRLAFLDIDAPDAAGHSKTFLPDNPDYIAAIEKADKMTAEVIDGILRRSTLPDEDWLFVLSTDHGGNANGHGDRDEANTTIFLLVAGNSVDSGEIVSPRLSHLDILPTIMHFLGVDPTPAWNLDGRVAGLLP